MIETRPWNYTWDSSVYLQDGVRLYFPVQLVETINDLKVTLLMSNRHGSPVSVAFTLSDGDANYSYSRIADVSVSVPVGTDNSITVDFSSSPARYQYGAVIYIEAPNIPDWPYLYSPISLKNPVIQYSGPNLTISANPASGYGGQYTTLNFQNRLGETLTLQGYIDGQAHGQPKTTSSDSYSWQFPTPSVFDTTAAETIVATDSLGRTASVTITGNEIPTGTFTPSSPGQGADINGGNPVTFRWSYSGPGSLVKSELSISGLLTISIDDGKTNHEIKAGLLSPGSNTWSGRGYDSIAGWSPWSSDVSFSVYYTATSQVVPSSSPTDGNISNYGPITFSVALEPSEPVPFDFLIDSASFYWRSGTSGSYTELAMTPEAGGLTASVTIAGGTFPNGTLQWYASATDDTGNTTLTDTFTLTVVNSAIVSTPVSPIATIQSGTGPVLFRWTYLTLDGSAQNGAELEYSTNGTVWVPFAGRSEITGDSTEYEAPAEMFPGGVVYWHVRSYTQDNTPGPWSQTVSFQCFAAPVVQAVVATSAPFSVITWQVEGQLAYEIQVDDKRYGPYFGANVRRYVLPEPLADELHTVRVRAQNKYGLWSEWAETTVFIRNIPSLLEITLTGFEMFGATLMIQKPLYQGTFYIYRDGKLIGKTTQSLYNDIRAVGTHQYYVLDVTQSGYYTKSNTVELDCPVKEPWICLLPEGPTLPLILSENAKRSQTITRGREVAYTQYAGAKYPEAEVGEHESLTVTGDVSFTQAQQEKAETFESFLGKRVVYKTPGGLCVAGVLEGFQRRDPKHWKSYTFSITQMEWEDYYDADSGILL